MKALTLRQPWASLVALGAKRVETRSWRTDYRGPLLITASATISKADHQLCYEEPFRTVLEQGGLIPPAGGIRGQTMAQKEQIPLGVALCVVDLLSCVHTESPSVQSLHVPYESNFGNFTPGRWAWILGRQIWLIPGQPKIRGSLGLWTPPADFAPVPVPAPQPSPDSSPNQT